MNVSVIIVVINVRPVGLWSRLVMNMNTRVCMNVGLKRLFNQTDNMNNTVTLNFALRDMAKLIILKINESNCIVY